ncbi:MAG: sugar transferase [Mycobacteriales bacterium]
MSVDSRGLRTARAVSTRDLTRLFGEAQPAGSTHPRHRRTWVRRYVMATVASDFVLSLAAALLAFIVRFGDSADPVNTWRYVSASVAFPFVYVAAIASARAYEPRFLGSGSEEYRRVFDGGIRLGALLAIISVGFQLSPARGYLAVSFPVAIAATLVGRYLGRRQLERLRSKGHCLNRVIAVGRERSVAELIRTVHADARSGFHVVGVCLDTRAPRDATQVEGVPVFGGTSAVLSALDATQGDAVAITAFSDLDTQAVRRLGWQLEGSDVSMLLAPRITDVAGPRIHIRPVGGLPLLHVEEPELRGVRRLLKGGFDRTLALLALLVLSPALLVVAVAVRLTSRGPALFRQERVGTHGETFILWKFRTMAPDAEDRLDQLIEYNKHRDGPLFKIEDDPRVTRLGRHLRRWSIDELPQLVQVVTGRMSLVGPRPPLPNEVIRYEDMVHRRLLVKPGVTGLWQISGRGDLSWDDSVRLDLQYVENWSLALDLTILWRTLAAVVASRGAY